MTENTDWIDYDKHHVWHPYSAIGGDLPVYPVVSASGVRLRLADGRELIDGMSSWWCAIHGYNHPEMTRAIQHQLKTMAHVMFGGLTHQPAVELAKKLIEITPAPLQSVFFTDSGSVAVEVAMKMAIQYWHDKHQPDKQYFLTIRKGYHGDTFGAMSLCDPDTGMHNLFSGVLPQQLFVEAPSCHFAHPCKGDGAKALRKKLKKHYQHIAAVVLEPIVQGTGGMRFYSAEYLKKVRGLCDQYGVLLILDEIATGFGRTGKLFACEHADVTADIMCVGKSLTGGSMSLAATLTTEEISNTISQGDPGLFMHGPTFMANPLACSAALASLQLLLDSPWQERIKTIEKSLQQGLAPCRELPQVEEVRVLGAIGVVEMKKPMDIKQIQPNFVDAGVWVRPFGKLVYLMPPFIISREDLKSLADAVVKVVETCPI
ncbi:MAG: adenosylmethionine--8-amino-7-oxononanoate transaminase [Candidatus Thiodiazotropha sp. (ex Lucinoma aequizonata)]|nr:adenosylmethionine--8-amino-7-oxononanoate transaminase [Candidatus Thiodiazotropha sp. (ex Lucinoma aequizonata)]MCU7889805.1 adenosylmethionine--8-amino-7-oxononanoate transaminase [Candidatus Thiodiazotropha sp. (ex Lucinoma aequizonata)]MCU7893822.1 adenosylmethionine--8-amino-7-oxononanoate transaminase [Candidatus Thiodiazotropha sp. (ex Lucinoma aequizonata)]MCU7900238.1 adenosylmethionine--8-amino-7-oxononanoate transaminase [Candidatus Thiodiazotropha sp. (ex Lucinoma aequizonata)]M